MSISNEYDPDFVNNMFGTVIKYPESDLIAGAYSTLEFEILIGEYGIDDGGHIILALPIVNGFGVPQFDNNTEENYTTVSTTGNAKLKYEFDHSGYIRPHKPCITVKIWDGSLKHGDKLKIVLGDTDKGSKGLVNQTYTENNMQIIIALDPFGTNLFTELPDSPKINIVSDIPASLTIKTKSQVLKEKDFWITVRVNDRYGNTAKYNGEIQIKDTTEEFSRNIIMSENDNGYIWINDCKLQNAGVYKFKAQSGNMSAISNPVEVLKEQPNYQLFWGDLHGQTSETVGSGTIQEYLWFGKKIAGLDFISHAANCFQVTNEIWKNTQDAIKQFHSPHNYITFLGYEWSGVTSAGGDHNVYYLKDDQPIHRCSHALIDDKSDLDTDRYPVSELYNEFSGREDVLIIPHIGGRRATLDVFDENLTPFIEIVSVHGHFQWFADEAMERRLKTGFICSSDTHSGRPGDTFPVTYIEAVPTGLTAVYAKELTRESLWKSFKSRHVYGTTGARIILSFTINNDMMGEVVENTKRVLKSRIIGTAPVEKAEIIRYNEVVYNHPLLNEKTKVKDEIIIRWSGARTQYRRRNTDWSGSISILNGKFIEVSQYAFDLPWEGIKSQTEKNIEFVSTTAGDYDGIKIKFDANHDTIIKFQNKITTYEFNPQKVTEPVILDYGKVEQSLEIVPVYEENYPEIVEFEYDSEGQSGAYYLRILQVDGEKAWSSPIFVEK